MLTTTPQAQAYCLDVSGRFGRVGLTNVLTSYCNQLPPTSDIKLSLGWISLCVVYIIEFNIKLLLIYLGYRNHIITKKCVTLSTCVLDTFRLFGSISLLLILY